jgi:hypothetical protein
MIPGEMRSALGVERLRNIRQVFIQTGLSFRHLAMVLQRYQLQTWSEHVCMSVIK